MGPRFHGPAFTVMAESRQTKHYRERSRATLQMITDDFVVHVRPGGGFQITTREEPLRVIFSGRMEVVAAWLTGYVHVRVAILPALRALSAGMRKHAADYWADQIDALIGGRDVGPGAGQDSR